MHDVRHGIEAIYPARSIEKPSAIAAPGMIALRISAIGGCQWMVLASAEPNTLRPSLGSYGIADHRGDGHPKA